MATASYRDREQWLAERKTGLGGSDAAVVLGVSPFKTARQLWREKTSDDPEPELNTPPILRGRYLEPVAAELYSQETGRQIRRQPLRRHAEHAFMLGNVDRQILAVGDTPSTGALEIKCPGLKVFAKVKAHGLLDYMTVQLMHYLAVLGYSWGSFALFNAENWSLIHFDLEADPGLIGQLIEREQEFWTKYVVPRVEPPAETEKATDIPQVEGEMTLVEGAEWRAAATDLREAHALRETAEELEDAAKERLQAMMHRDELHAAEVPGLVRMHYKWMAGNTKWKETAQAIARAAQLNVDEFVVKGAGHTRFTPYYLSGETED